MDQKMTDRTSHWLRGPTLPVEFQSAPESRSTASKVAWVVLMVVGSVGVGALFGMLSWTYDSSSAGWGELGSPWALVAFAVGAIIAKSSRFASVRIGATVATASLAGTTALVVAVAVNYRTGLSNVLPMGELTHARGWGTAAMGTGIVIGGLGAVWGVDTSGRRARWSSNVLASIMTGEAILGIVRGQFLTAIERGALANPTFHMYVILLAIGLAISAATAPSQRRLRSVAITLALMCPAALLIDYFYASIY